MCEALEKYLTGARNWRSRVTDAILEPTGLLSEMNAFGFEVHIFHTDTDTPTSLYRGVDIAVHTERTSGS
jgi:hypothetical protein